MRQLKSKRVLITGAAQGIGRELALAFGREGALVVLTDIRADLLAEAKAAVQATGAEAHAYVLDVTDEEGIRAARQRILDELGPIDILVNNAGLVFGGSLTDVPLSQHRLTYEVNTLGLVAMTHIFLPDLISRPEAHLVTIASASAYIGLPYGSTYASSKWAALGFSESIRFELQDQGHRHVHVTTVCPSYVSTGLFAGAKAPRTTRFIEPPALARDTIWAVKHNRVFLIRPRTVYLTPFLNGFLPTWLLDRIARLFGVNSSMLFWRGRGPASNPASRQINDQRPEPVPSGSVSP